MVGYFANSFSDDVQNAWLETRRTIDPKKVVKLTAANGKSAQAIVLSFLERFVLKNAGRDDKLPSMVEILRTDFVSMNLGDRAQVSVLGRQMQLMVIGNDPIDPTVQLSCEVLS